MGYNLQRIVFGYLNRKILKKTATNLDQPLKKLLCPAEHIGTVETQLIFLEKAHEIKLKRLYPANILEIDNQFLCHIC